MNMIDILHYLMFFTLIVLLVISVLLAVIKFLKRKSVFCNLLMIGILLGLLFIEI